MKNKEKLFQIWWADIHPLDKVVLARKYFPNIHFYHIEDKHIEYMYKKEVEGK